MMLTHLNQAMPAIFPMPDFHLTVATAQHVPLIGDAIADVLSEPELKGDAVHPNAEGHARLAEKIYKKLQSIGYAG